MNYPLRTFKGQAYADVVDVEAKESTVGAYSAYSQRAKTCCRHGQESAHAASNMETKDIASAKPIPGFAAERWKLTYERQMSKNRRKRASNKEKLDPLTRSRFERLKKHKWILAFGDSLTAGFRDAFKRHTPYAKNLQSTLRAEATSYMNSERHETKQQRKASMQWKGCRVVVEAVCGESTQEMLPRLELSLQEAAKNGIRYDTIVILAGTNDLISLREVDDIALSMREMIAAVADAGIARASFALCQRWP